MGSARKLWPDGAEVAAVSQRLCGSASFSRNQSRRPTYPQMRGRDAGKPRRSRKSAQMPHDPDCKDNRPTACTEAVPDGRTTMIATKHLFIAKLLVCAASAAASVGCGAAGASGRPTALAGDDIAPVRIAQTRVVHERVNPMVPVHLATEGSSITATFGLPGHRQMVTRLAPSSLELLSSEQTGRSEEPSPPSTGAARVELDGGRFLVCGTRDKTDGGHEAVAQMWTASGSPLGAPMVISPPDADVFGAPRAATVDGRHVLVTFPETSGGPFELRAVSVEDAERPVDSNRLAQR
jgi:hypothetical protein